MFVAILFPLLTAAVVWGSTKQRLISHEELDRVRFFTLEVLLKEVRDDTKTILKNGRAHAD